MNQYSPIDDTEVDKLKSRWENNPIKKSHLSDMLKLPNDQSWFERYEKVKHTWVSGDLSDVRGLTLFQTRIGANEICELALYFSEFKECDFEGTCFQYSDFTKASFSSCKFYKAQLLQTFGKATYFNDCKFDNTGFQWSKLISIWIKSSLINKSRFDGIDWSGLCLINSKLESCRFFDSNLNKSTFVGNVFDTCELNLTNISYSKISETIFKDSEIGGTDFRGCTFNDVVFKNCKFSLTHMGSNITPTRFDDLPHIRAMVEAGGSEGLETIEWCIPEKAIAAGEVDSYTARVLGGELCIRSGYWWTPAKADSRQWFEQGALMPSFETDFGVVIWQWDENQA